MNKKVLLSFDIEEFDLPREGGIDISLQDAMSVSKQGTIEILKLLKSENVRATFFCTTTFAENAPELIKQMIADGHEVASHGCNHSDVKNEDIARSKNILENRFGIKIYGYRQPRMFATDVELLTQSGYLYDTSVHPAFIPGRYMNLNEPMYPYKRGGILEIPVSVTPTLRLPVFWLALHNYPMMLYTFLAKSILSRTKKFIVYFHPWEFVDLNAYPQYKISWIIRRNSGPKLVARLQKLIATFKKENAIFTTFHDSLEDYKEI